MKARALMGRAIFPYERYGIYERSWVYPMAIEVATGSASALHKSPAYAIFVHQDNPLAQLTVRQLDGIFPGVKVWESFHHRKGGEADGARLSQCHPMTDVERVPPDGFQELVRHQHGC